MRGLRGPIGSGKSTACCYEIIRRGCEQRPAPDGVARTRWAVVRNTYPELKTTTIRTWHALIPQHAGEWFEQGPPRHLLRMKHEAGHIVEIEVIFIALDSQADVRKVLSLELTGAWVNEAREIPKAVIDALTGRVGRYPRAQDGGATWSGIILDTNPPDTDHWWYTLAERDAGTEQGRQLVGSVAEAETDLRRMGVLGAEQPLFEFFAQPAGISADAENLPNLPAGYYQLASAGKTEDWVRVYVRGEYGFVQDGKPVHPAYRDSLHCRPAQYLPPLPLVVGMDFGLTPAAVYLQMSVAGQWRVVGELVATDMGVARFAEVLARDIQQRFPGARADFYGDPAGDTRDAQERTVFDILRAKHVAARPAPSQEPTIRRAALTGPLSRLIDGEPGLIVDPSCSYIRKGLGGKFRYRRVAVAGDARYEDRPEKNAYSHPCEALEYGLLGGGENPKALPRGTAPIAPVRVKNHWTIYGR